MKRLIAALIAAALGWFTIVRLYARIAAKLAAMDWGEIIKVELEGLRIDGEADAEEVDGSGYSRGGTVEVDASDVTWPSVTLDNVTWLSSPGARFVMRNGVMWLEPDDGEAVDPA